MNSATMTGLLPALAAAIAAMPDPKKNKKNDHFRNSYADLGAVLECLTQPLADNGLVLTQTVRAVYSEGQSVQTLVTRVWHCKSGEWLESEILLQPEKNTPQGYASAMTYARRYSIKALFGMSDVDDDGNTASGTRAPAAAKPFQVRATEKRDPAMDVKAKPIVVADLAEPFELVEEAVTAIHSSITEADMQGTLARIRASKFRGEDLEIAQQAWKDRQKLPVRSV